MCGFAIPKHFSFFFFMNIHYKEVVARAILFHPPSHLLPPLQECENETHPQRTYDPFRPSPALVFPVVQMEFDNSDVISSSGTKKRGRLRQRHCLKCQQSPCDVNLVLRPIRANWIIWYTSGWGGGQGTSDFCLPTGRRRMIKRDGGFYLKRGNGFWCHVTVGNVFWWIC